MSSVNDVKSHMPSIFATLDEQSNLLSNSLNHLETTLGVSSPSGFETMDIGIYSAGMVIVAIVMWMMEPSYIMNPVTPEMIANTPSGTEVDPGYCFGNVIKMFFGISILVVLGIFIALTVYRAD